MTDFQIRSDNVDVEQIMRQIRARIREKRGVDYTEDEIRELARVKLEKFLDPTGVRSDLLAQFRRTKDDGQARNFKFEDTTLFESDKAIVRFIRNLLRPILKLFFNPNPLVEALHIQSDLNTNTLRREDLYYELIHNLVLETTRLGIQVKNLKMQVESMSSRLDFDERRARALEGVVQYRPGTVPPLQPPLAGGREARESREDAASQERRTRRRRRRGRRPASAREAGYGEASADARGDAGFGGTRANGDAREQSEAGSGGTGSADAREHTEAGSGGSSHEARQEPREARSAEGPGAERPAPAAAEPRHESE